MIAVGMKVEFMYTNNYMKKRVVLFTTLVFLIINVPAIVVGDLCFTNSKTLGALRVAEFSMRCLSVIIGLLYLENRMYKLLGSKCWDESSSK